MSSRDVIVRRLAPGSDTGHLVLSGLTVAEILALLGAGSGAFGTRFRIYSLTSAAVVLLSGALTSRQAAKLANGQPTPRMGLYERISIGTWLQWMAALATTLLREQRPLTGRSPPVVEAPATSASGAPATSGTRRLCLSESNRRSTSPDLSLKMLRFQAVSPATNSRGR